MIKQSVRFGSNEWQRRELSKPRRDPKPLPPLTNRRVPKVIDFVGLSRDLMNAGSAANQAALTGILLSVREPIHLKGIGAEANHFKSVYRAAAQLIMDRQRLNRETIVSFAPGFNSTILKDALARQGGDEVFNTFVDAVKTCAANPSK